MRTGWSKVRIPVQARDFPFYKTSRTVLGPTQPPTQWEPRFFPRGKATGTSKLSTHFHLVPRLRMSGATLLLGHVPSWHGQGTFYLYFSVLTLNLLTTNIVAPPSNASKWQMGFNSAFKGLIINNFCHSPSSTG